MCFFSSEFAQVNKLRLEEMKDEPLKFTLAAKTPGGDNLIIQAMTPEDKEKWVKEVKVLIAQQADMLRGKGLTLLISGKGWGRWLIGTKYGNVFLPKAELAPQTEI